MLMYLLSYVDQILHPVDTHRIHVTGKFTHVCICMFAFY